MCGRTHTHALTHSLWLIFCLSSLPLCCLCSFLFTTRTDSDQLSCDERMNVALSLAYFHLRAASGALKHPGLQRGPGGATVYAESDRSALPKTSAQKTPSGYHRHGCTSVPRPRLNNLTNDDETTASPSILQLLCAFQVIHRSAIDWIVEIKKTVLSENTFTFLWVSCLPSSFNHFFYTLAHQDKIRSLHPAQPPHSAPIWLINANQLVLFVFVLVHADLKNHVKSAIGRGQTNLK